MVYIKSMTERLEWKLGAPDPQFRISSSQPEEKIKSIKPVLYTVLALGLLVGPTYLALNTDKRDIENLANDSFSYIVNGFMDVLLDDKPKANNNSKVKYKL